MGPSQKCLILASIFMVGYELQVIICGKTNLWYFLFQDFKLCSIIYVLTEDYRCKLEKEELMIYQSSYRNMTKLNNPPQYYVATDPYRY